MKEVTILFLPEPCATSKTKSMIHKG